MQGIPQWCGVMDDWGSKLPRTVDTCGLRSCVTCKAEHMRPVLFPCRASRSGVM
jgi:hypothetical protein